MSPPGRPKGELPRSAIARREVQTSPPGRPKGELPRSATARREVQ